MKENPYASPEATVELVADNQPQRLSDSSFEIVHNIFRGLGAFLGIGCGPVLIVPAFSDMFSEFGVELPYVTQCVVQFSRFAAQFPYAFLLLTFSLFVAIEFGLFWLPQSMVKTLLNVGYWLMLVLVIGVSCFSLSVVIQAISTSL